MKSIRCSALALIAIAVAGGAAAGDDWGRDPFTFGHGGNGAASAAAGKSGIVLEMTLVRDGGGIAVINGSRYKVGDIVDGGVIKSIELDSVTLLKEGKLVTIKTRDGG
ncbi:MAG: hypothetical protein HZB29_04225 [Nitrospinae bacterium]|nr:hypothetical protein [Nitrospinota bacterium]